MPIGKSLDIQFDAEPPTRVVEIGMAAIAGDAIPRTTSQLRRAQVWLQQQVSTWAMGLTGLVIGSMAQGVLSVLYACPPLQIDDSVVLRIAVKVSRNEAGRTRPSEGG